MMKLDYKLISAGFGAEVDLALIDEMTLRYSCFLGDVLFHAGDLDLSMPWGWVPVLDTALSLRDVVGSVASGSPAGQLAGTDPVSAVFEFTESDETMVFSQTHDVVRLSATWVSGSVLVDYAELYASVQAFARRVILALVDEFPALAANPLVVAELSVD